MNTTITRRLAALGLAAGAVLGVAAPALTTTVAASAATVSPQGLNTCKKVLVQKQLPWYQCINTMPGTNYLPAACYGPVYKTVCTQY